jgi:hypothetical protein
VMALTDLVFTADTPVALPIALGWLAALYGLPSLACWFAWRKKSGGAALIVGSLAMLISAYAAVVEWPESAADFWFWLLVAAVPLLLSLLGVTAAFRARRKVSG